MNKRCALLLPFLPLAAVPLTACSSPECASNFDCGLYMQCTEDGVCVAGDRPDVVGGGSAADFGGDFGDGDDEGDGDEGAIVVGEAHFAGTIGNASIDAPMQLWISRLDGGMVLQFNSTVSPSFVVLTVDDASALAQPGTFVVDDSDGEGVVSGYGQGCDDSAGHYDELLPPPVVNVPAPAEDDPEAVPVVSVEFPDTGDGMQLGDAPGVTRGVATFGYRLIAR